MATDATDLGELFVDVTGKESLTERQAEEPSRDPIGGEAVEVQETVSGIAERDGLDDAVEGAEATAVADS